MKTNELDTLLSRYYEGLTTHDEELRLRQLLATDNNRQHDADRAVFGLLAAKRKFTERPQHRIWTFSRVAAMLTMVFCLGAAAATITYHIVNEQKNADEPITEKQHTILKPQQTTNVEKTGSTEVCQEEIRLTEDTIFKNLSLSEIANKITAIFGYKVEIADKEIADLRLYLTLPKGCTVHRFVEIIDAYDALEASFKDNIITIKRQEAQP